jgi:AcrR family transcriptional regulator
MNRNAERGRATREQLVDVALRLFGASGYEDTSIEAVLREAGVSRGSLYHHFPSKDALFLAAMERLEEQFSARAVEATANITDPVALLRAGALSWVQLAADPVIQRVMLIDAPTVLGWQRWREFDEQHVLGDIKSALAMVAAEGVFDASYVDVFAHIVLAAVNETALMIARADDVQAAIATASGAVDEFLRRLLAPGP